MAPTPAIDVPVLLYSPEQCAQALTLSRTTIYEFIRSGKLRAVHVRTAPGRRPVYRIEPADLTRFVEQLRRETQQQRAGIVRMVAR